MKMKVEKDVKLVVSDHGHITYVGIDRGDGNIDVGGYLLIFYPDGRTEAVSGASLARMFNLDAEDRLIVDEG